MSPLANMDVRQKAKAAGVQLWRVSKHLGVPDSTMTRRLREELPEQEKARFYAAIETLSSEREGLLCD